MPLLESLPRLQPNASPALPEIYLLPGESYLATGPTVLRTVLGSCVGVAFLIPRLGVGALCHPMLPRYPARPLADASVATGRRYVDFAIGDLAGQFSELGATPDEVEVKVFGGGDVLMSATASARPTVGRMNCESALETLEAYGFAIAASSLGGKTGIHIVFNTATGEVLLRRLNGCASAHD